MSVKAFLLFPALIGLVLAGGHAAVSQDQAKTDGGKTVDETAKQYQIRTYQLRHVQAKEVIGAAMSIFGNESDLRVAAEPGSNAVIAAGAPREIDELFGLLKELDQSPGAAHDLTVKIISLEHADANELGAVLQQVVGMTGTRITADPRVNSLIVSGKLDSLQIVEALIQNLDLENIAKDTEAKDQKGADDFRILRLAHSDAAETASLLMQALDSRGSSLCVVPDQQHNSLIFRGSKLDIDIATDLVQQIDIGTPSGPLELKAFDLGNRDGHAIVEMLFHLFGDQAKGMRLAYDEGSNSILCYASKEDSKIVEAILENLDLPNENSVAHASPVTSESQTYKVRLIWLAASENPEDRTALSEDLQPVEKELAAFGLHNLRVAGQLMVNTSGAIQASGQVAHAGNVYALDGNGAVESVADRLRLTLSVDLAQLRGGERAEGARFDGRQSGRQVATTSTEIFTQPGHFTVLGISPAEEETAIFVVQVVAE